MGKRDAIFPRKTHVDEREREFVLVEYVCVKQREREK